MKRIPILSIAVGLLLSVLILTGTSVTTFAEESQIIQDFEGSNLALGSWGGIESEIIDDDSGVSTKSLHLFFESDAEQYCGIDIPVDEFPEDYNTLRFRYKGTASKNVTSLYLYDAGSERFTTTYTDKVNGWTTVEIPLKRFVVDSWQPDNADINKVKDYPFKTLTVQRGTPKKGNDFCIDEIEAVKK